MYLLIRFQLNAAGLSLIDLRLVPVHRQDVVAEVELVNGQVVTPGVILEDPYMAARRRTMCMRLLNDWRAENFLSILKTLRLFSGAVPVRKP